MAAGQGGAINKITVPIGASPAVIARADPRRRLLFESSFYDLSPAPRKIADEKKLAPKFEAGSRRGDTVAAV